MNIDEGLFYKVLGETSGLEIENEEELMQSITELAAAKREYDKIKDAIDQVNATGYGIVMPSIDELTLDEPEIVKQGGRYGVAAACLGAVHPPDAGGHHHRGGPHVGSENVEDLVMYLLKEFEDSPEKIWQSNIFGKSLHELVNEGLHNKLSRMPGDAAQAAGDHRTDHQRGLQRPDLYNPVTIIQFVAGFPAKKTARIICRAVFASVWAAGISLRNRHSGVKVWGLPW